MKYSIIALKEEKEFENKQEVQIAPLGLQADCQSRMFQSGI